MSPSGQSSGPTDLPETEVSVDTRRAERLRLAEERQATRRTRRRRDQQFLGVLLIVAVLFFAFGIGLARTLWHPKPPAPDHTGALPQTPSPDQAAAPVGDALPATSASPGTGDTGPQ